MRPRKLWRRFRPLSKPKGIFHDQTIFEADTIYTEARKIIKDSLHESRNVKHFGRRTKRINEAVRRLTQRDIYQPEFLLARLILQTPSAACAQIDMDKNKGGYTDRRARLFELIDFNDTYVDTVLALPEQYLENFTHRLHHEMAVFCQQMHLPMFTDKQYDAIIHGLNREIALFRTAKKLGYVVRMTSRLQDAMGIDMVITDPNSKKSINVDCKTRSAYHFRLRDLLNQRRIDEERRLRCELMGFCLIQNGGGDKAVDTVLFRIATEDLGGIKDFDFINPHALSEQLYQAIEHHGSFIV